MPLILVTNDDGVTSDGIHALADAVRPLGDVIVVAPLQEASAIGHALTLRRPLRIELIRDGVYGHVDRMLVIRHGRVVVNHRYPQDYAAISRGRQSALGCGNITFQHIALQGERYASLLE